MRKLKKVVKMAAFDSLFISSLLVIVFGEETLKISSAGVKMSNFNNATHVDLDPVKLQFVQGKQVFLIYFEFDFFNSMSFDCRCVQCTCWWRCK